MNKKFDEVQLYKEKILKSGIPEKKLKQLIKEKKVEKNQILGKNAIDDKGALSLIAGDLGVSLVPQPSISTKPKSEFERYLDYRDNSREMCMYILDALDPKIDDLINQMEKIEVDEKLKIAQANNDTQQITDLKAKKYKELETKLLDDEITDTGFIFHELKKAKKIIKTQLIPSLFKNDDEWKRPNNYNSLYSIDSGLFNDIPKLFKEIFNTIFLAFLRNGHARYMSLQGASSLFTLHRTFENENSRLRYPVGRTIPYTAPRNNPNNWERDMEAPDEFLQCFSGFLQFADSLRNFEAHKTDPKTKERFDHADRVIKDPLTGMSSPGNFIILANNSVSLMYEFIELIQVWLDSKAIEKKFS